MAATYITMAELRTLLGIGTLYLDATVEEVAQASEDILKKYLWFNTVPISGTALASNVATIYTPVPHELRIDQSVVISSAGTVFNGTKTITGTTIYSFTYAKTASDQLAHVVRPYGLVTAEFHAQDYATVPAIREAAATLASTIWNARQMPGATTVTIDGFIANPFALGGTLIGKVKGLIAPYMSPSSMIGWQMTAAITTLRSTLATALTNAGVWSVFSYIPQAPIANSVVVVNDDPFIVVQSGQKTGIAPIARYRIYGLVPMLDNQGNQINIEDFIVAIFAKLSASTLVMTVGSFSAPAILETPAGNLLQTEVGVEIISSWG